MANTNEQHTNKQAHTATHTCIDSERACVCMIFFSVRFSVSSFLSLLLSSRFFLVLLWPSKLDLLFLRLYVRIHKVM